MDDSTPPAVAAQVDLGRALSALLRRYLEGAGSAIENVPGGPRGFQVLSIADEGACSNQAMIATRLGLDRTVMTYLVDDLEQVGLVERRPDPADRRARQVVVTPQGRTLLETSTARIRDVERTVLAGLSDAEVETFRSLLARATDGTPDDHSACGAPVPEC